MGIISGYNGARRYSQPSSVTKIFTDEVTVGTTSSNQGPVWHHPRHRCADLAFVSKPTRQTQRQFSWSESSWSHEWIQTQCQ